MRMYDKEILSKYSDYDRIYLDDVSIERLEEAYDRVLEKKGIGADLDTHIPMAKGLFILEGVFTNKEKNYLSFTGDDNGVIKFKFYMGFTEEPVLLFETTHGEISNFKIVDPLDHLPRDEKVKMKAAFSNLAISTLQKFLMFFYLMNNKEEAIATEHQRVAKVKKKGNTKKKKGKTKNVVYINRTTYRINTDVEELFEKEKRPHNWNIDAFNRAGHWRTYKNGRRVWIKPTTVYTSNKEKAKITPKEYRV